MNRQVFQFILTSFSQSDPFHKSGFISARFSHSLFGTVNALQCPQPTPVPEVTFSIDVLENK